MGIETQAVKRVLVVHRRYRVRGGEDVFFDRILVPSLRRLGVEHHVLEYSPLNTSKDAAEIAFMAAGIETARPSARIFKQEFQNQKFSHVIFNNFVPTLSLELPQIAKQHGARTFAWVHNFRSFCANGLIFNGESTCRRCLEKGSHWALVQNCNSSRVQSAIYASAYRGRRIPELLFDGRIDQFFCVSEFVKRELAQAAATVGAKPAMSVIRIPPDEKKLPVGERPERFKSLGVDEKFYLYLGRLSYEKGPDRFIDLARKYSDKNFVLAGDGIELTELKSSAPRNVVFTGNVNETEKAWLFANAEALIVSSRVAETSSMVIAESHPYQTPVVYTSGGGAEETVKWLGRQGCPLEAFNGQSFEYKTAIENLGMCFQAFDGAIGTSLEL
jgi:glycosyltransferase involved in cell wall biosynthesis